MHPLVILSFEFYFQKEYDYSRIITLNCSFPLHCQPLGGMVGKKDARINSCLILITCPRAFCLNLSEKAEEEHITPL